jgi:hypothetical protein
MVKTYVFILCLAFVADYVSGGALPQWRAHSTQSKSINVKTHTKAGLQKMSPNFILSDLVGISRMTDVKQEGMDEGPIKTPNPKCSLY